MRCSTPWSTIRRDCTFSQQASGEREREGSVHSAHVEGIFRDTPLDVRLARSVEPHESVSFSSSPDEDRLLDGTLVDQRAHAFRMPRKELRGSGVSSQRWSSRAETRLERSQDGQELLVGLAARTVPGVVGSTSENRHVAGDNHISSNLCPTEATELTSSSYASSVRATWQSPGRSSRRTPTAILVSPPRSPSSSSDP